MAATVTSQRKPKRLIHHSKVYLWALTYLFRYKWMFALTLVCSGIMVAAELAIPKIIQYIIDVVLPQKNTRMLYILLVALIPIVAVVVLVSAYRNQLNRIIQERSARDLQLSVLGQLRRLGFSYYEKQSTGATLSLFNNEVGVVQKLYRSYFPRMVQQTIFAIFSVIVLLDMNVKLFLVIIPFFLSYYLVGPRFERKQAIHAREAAAHRTEYNKKLYDSVSALLELRVNQAEEWDMERLKQRLSHFRRSSLLDMYYASLRGTTRRLSTNVGAIVLFIVGAKLIQSGELLVGEFTAYMLYYFRVMGGLTGLVTTITEQSVLLYQAEKLYDYMHLAPDVSEPEKPTVLKQMEGDIRFNRVSFHYRDDATVLNDFDLHVRPGEKVALVGASGSGKSTVTKLLGRFYDPVKGEILLDSVPLRDLSFEQLRNVIGFVFQETYLFGTTIRDNIRFGRPDASDDEIIEASKHAFAHDFIMQFPDGYDTLVGERGVKLSGGQKQRIAIARMMLKNPSIVVLDEATSALDNISEREVLQALNRLLQGRTTITVAHRLSTVKDYDRIVVMERGTIVEMGTYEELMRQRGYLYRLVEGEGEMSDEEKSRLDVEIH